MSNSRFTSILSKFSQNYRDIFGHLNYRIQQSQMSASTQTALYEEIKGVKNNQNVMLIDVRDVKEVKNTGQIPGSVVIPLNELGDALKNLSDDEFRRRYHREKPAKDFPLIFTCYSGKRAGQAREIAKKLGYQCCRTYQGSWKEYAAKNGLPA